VEGEAMTETYEMLSLGDLIDRLKKLGDAPVRGLGKRVFSYRGYYERHDVAPSFEDEDWPGVYGANVLVEAYESQLGAIMTGYKGGDYPICREEAVYLAGYGDTGPAIACWCPIDSPCHGDVLLELANREVGEIAATPATFVHSRDRIGKPRTCANRPGSGRLTYRRESTK